MKRPQIIVFVLAVVLFTIGAATGALAHRFYVANAVNASEDWRVRYINEMHSRLKLTTQQVDKLNDILDDTRAKVRAVKDSYKPEMLQIKQNQTAQIRAMLTAGQSTEYSKRVEEQEAKAKEQDERDRRIEEQRAVERHLREEREAQGTTK
jgi:hypothetical protein